MCEKSKIFKYRVIPGPYFPVFRLNKGKYGPEINLIGHFSRSVCLMKKRKR